MLVDNPLQQAMLSFNDGGVSEFSEFLNTDLFGPQSGSPGSSSSRASSPQSLMTPPQGPLQTTFPEVQDNSLFNYGGAGSNFSLNSTSQSFFNFLEDEVKNFDPASLSMDIPSTSGLPYDFLGAFGNASGSSTLNTLLSSSTSPATSTSSVTPVMSIDPQLVDSPSTSNALSDFGDDDDDDDDDDAGEQRKREGQKLTLTITPMKVAGHGKSRKGTVQSGGVVKKATSVPSATVNSITSTPLIAAKDKENVSGKSRSLMGLKGAPTVLGVPEDDLPEDWRPPPEVFQKMSSKEKRQLRNKISARNFRVRRKEYISTLEMDIAERDRLLQAIRTELGSTQSENLALRQEIAALKKALLEGRSGVLTADDVPILNLPPPAPLPLISAAASLSSSSTSSPPANSSTPLVTPNTHKDLPVNVTSPRLGAFWGGVSNAGLGLGGGTTPVHTVLMPEMSILAKASGVNVNGGGVRATLQENLNPALNNSNTVPSAGRSVFGGFDGFADLNPFTMKSLDAYRMQLWTKMASQHHPNHQAHNIHPVSSPQHPFNPPSPPPLIGSPSPFTNSSLPYPSPSNSPLQLPLSGLASSLKPHHFTSPTNKSIVPPPMGNTLSALLSGKHTLSTSTYPSPPSTPPLGNKRQSPPIPASHGPSQKEKEQAVYAAIAGHTLLRRLGNAFWDAFSGSQGSSHPSVASGSKDWDPEKVRKVLEGKAVVKVVDLESEVVEKRKPALTEKRPMKKQQDCGMTALLEESMRSLTLGKK